MIGTALATPIFLSVAPTFAQASATTVYAIPAQPLSSALVEFSNVTGVQLFFNAGAVRGLSSPGASGAFTREEALSRLLAGSGLSYDLNGNAVTIADPTAVPVVYDGSIVLEQIDVTAWVQDAASGSGFQGTPDWVYEAAESISVVSREAIISANARDARDLLGNVAGAYVNSANATYPSVSPNLRGIQDMGRVVVTVDGARQNNASTMTAGSEAYQAGSSHAYVDSAFIRSVEVDKNAGSGANNAGSLGGSVTFRTLGAEDLIAQGNNAGLEINIGTGTNNHYFDGSILGAARLADTPFSVTGGLSGLNLGNYRIGQNGVLNWGGDPGEQTELMGRENWSSLFKLEGDFGDLTTALTWTHQAKDFAYSIGGAAFAQDMVATTDTLTARADWNPADNDLIDLRANLWLNNTLTNQLRRARVTSGITTSPDTYIDSNLLSFGFSLDNTSRFDTPAGPLTLDYGAEAFRDVSTVTATSDTIALNPTWASNYTAFTPAGNRDMASIYANATLEPTDWVKLSGGIRYDWARLHGSSTYYSKSTITTNINIPCDPVGNHYTATQYYNLFIVTAGGSPPPEFVFVNFIWPGIANTECMPGTGINEDVTTTNYPASTLDIDRTYGAWLPSLTAEFTPVDWFKPYVSYGHSFRPPTIGETFLAGGLPGDGQPGTNYAPYDDLKPETARTWEIGANILADDVFLANDALRVKVAAFYREIENYIVASAFVRSDVPNAAYLGYVNVSDLTRMRGIELEGNYDAGQFWLGGSFTYLETEWGKTTPSYVLGADVVGGEAQLYSGGVPPKFRLVLDGGVRLLEETLSLGGRITHVTPTMGRTQSLGADGQYLTEEYTTLDLYGSYRLSDNATLRLSVDNVFDTAYVPAGSLNPAPGRTFLGSLNVKF